jgi:hypothetical protein
MIRAPANNNRDVPGQEPLMMLRQECISGGGEEEFPWLH